MFHVKHNPNILLVNPWIVDFSAYNFWIKPLGLLYIASLLRRNGFHVTLIDCLDYYKRVKEYGDGKFFKTIVEKPGPLRKIPRNLSQYGIPEELLLKRFSSIERPDLVCISSGMTYWYIGVFKLIEIIKKFFKDIPILLGGIYATLCYEHAVKYSGADIVFKSGNEVDALKIISEITQFPITQFEFNIDQLPYPSFELYNQLHYISLLTSRGCPFRCIYCASPILSKGFIRRDPKNVVSEIEYWVKDYHVENIAFFDDALLLEASNYFIPMMKDLIKSGIRCNFHTPNGLHVKAIDEEVASLLFRGGFKNIRLGFETSNEERQIESGGKVSNKDFLNAIKYLKKAGYSGGEIGVYIMAGLPGQRVEEVKDSIEFVKSAGAKPILVEYSPVPKTKLFEKAKKFSEFDLENEPLFHNNSIIPCQWEGFTIGDYRRLKKDLKGYSI